MTSLVRLLCATCVLASAVRAAAPVTVNISAPASAAPIPADFVGLSFETSNVVPFPDGTYQFSAANRQLVTLFRNIGIKNLRVGGGTVEPKQTPERQNPRFRVPAPADIDQLFAFADAADVKVIYSLRLLFGDPAQAAQIARYIADHYRAHLDSFSIGNEPDWHAYHTYPGHPLDPAIVETVPGEPGSAYPSYLARWREFAAAILAVVPDAKFTGPDTGSNWPEVGGKDTTYRGKSWTENFAADVRAGGHVITILPHDYVGQSAKDVSVATAVDAMLSRTWLNTHYPALYDAVLAKVQAVGLPYRMTECNDYTGGVNGASNAFCSALWALDYLHWHAVHGAVGLNFHNNRWLVTDTVIRTPTGEYTSYPKAYGLKAFSLASNGQPARVVVGNPESVNLTAYAVVNDRELFVTLINKEHDVGARSAAVTLTLPHPVAEGATLALVAPGNDPRAQQGITLGGDSITNDRAWAGRWAALPPREDGRWIVEVPPTSALLVKFSP